MLVFRRADAHGMGGPALTLKSSGNDRGKVTGGPRDQLRHILRQELVRQGMLPTPETQPEEPIEQTENA